MLTTVATSKQCLLPLLLLNNAYYYCLLVNNAYYVIMYFDYDRGCGSSYTIATMEIVTGRCGAHWRPVKP